MASDTNIHELAGGDIAVWQDEAGTVFLKLQEKYGDPVELGEEEALELAELLIQLVKSGLSLHSTDPQRGPAPR